MKLLTKREDAKQNRNLAIVQLGVDYSTIVVKNVAFNDGLQDLTGIVAQISGFEGDAGLNVTGFALAKNANKKDLSAEGKTMAGRIYAYAAKTGNVPLKKMV